MISTTFTYDPNGNQTSGNGHTATWTSYNKPASITQGSTTIGFLDGPDHQRFQQVTAQGTTLYMDGFGLHAELVMGSSWTWNEYLAVGNVPVGVRFINGGTTTTRYFHTDHLGSISVITDQSGAVVQQLSYDAWGKRRFANGADDPTGAITGVRDRNSLFPNMSSLLLLQKFPVTANREKCHRRPILRLTPPQIFIPNGRNGKFPCIFPCYQGISRGDWFAMDWVVSQPVWTKCRTSACRKRSRHFRALAPEN